MNAFSLRLAQPSDAPAIVGLMRCLLGEPNHNLRRDVDEYTTTAAQEAESIHSHLAAPNSTYLVAEAQGQIIGFLTCTGSPYRAEQHTTELSLAIDSAWRGQGVGAALMQAAITWAQGTGTIKRISLFVFARNAGAVRLYEKLGFLIEGRLRKDMYRGGEYLETLLMGLVWD